MRDDVARAYLAMKVRAGASSPERLLATGDAELAPALISTSPRRFSPLAVVGAPIAVAPRALPSTRLALARA